MIFFLDDDNDRADSLVRWVAPAEVDRAKDVPEACSKLLDRRYRLILLDHDLNGNAYAPSDEQSGFAVAMALTQIPRHICTPVIVHTWNDEAALRMCKVLRTHGYTVERIRFGAGLRAHLRSLR